MYTDVIAVAFVVPVVILSLILNQFCAFIQVIQLNAVQSEVAVYEDVVIVEKPFPSFLSIAYSYVQFVAVPHAITSAVFANAVCHFIYSGISNVAEWPIVGMYNPPADVKAAPLASVT